LTCRIPCGPVRVNKACCLDEAQRVVDRGLWARSIAAATPGSATAHSVDTDFTGENVRSKMATVCVRGRELFAICPANSQASIGATAMLNNKELPGHLGANPRN
jgi:hypothetical protein